MAAVATPRSWLGGRCFSSGPGAFGDDFDDEKPSGGHFPDSWVEPEALWEYAQDHRDGKDIDDAFAVDFGKRNKEWRDQVIQTDPEIFSRIGKGQAPKYLWIGCCDSRVAAENLVGGQPGEIFVHRNIANMVVSTDANLRAVLHYAVDYLQVEHLIVCGHYDCGGVKAAMSNRDHSSPVEQWLTQIRDVYRMHHEELDAILDDEERHKRLVELNVKEQCLNLFKTGDVQRRRTKTAQRPDQYPCALPRIHAMVFSPDDGILRRLPIDWGRYLRRWKNIYQMYDTEDFIGSHETP